MTMNRKLAREIAKRRMKQEGLQHVCKPIVQHQKCDNSKFAKHWKEWVKA